VPAPPDPAEQAGGLKVGGALLVKQLVVTEAVDVVAHAGERGEQRGEGEQTGVQAAGGDRGADRREVGGKDARQDEHDGTGPASANSRCRESR
jgi:hypothetical protein